MKKYIAEFIGTFTLTLLVGLSLVGEFAIATPILAALIVGIFVYTIGHISGTHLNPAVTIGAWSIKKISTKDALVYVATQFGASVAALILLSQAGSVVSLVPITSFSLLVAGAEIVGTFFLTFGIAAVIFEKNLSSMSGVIIGGSLLMGIASAVLLGSNGVLNPAVALGIGSFNLAYALSPIIGGVLGMQAYKWLNSK